jgi:hypothetical protein
MMTPEILLAVALAGIAGCIATGIAFNALTGRPASLVWGRPAKHFWSILFALPVPLILGAGIPMGAAVIIAFLWLMLAPNAASNLHFGPKDATWSRLMTLHSVFGIVALTAYAVAVRVLA